MNALAFGLSIVIFALTINTLINPRARGHRLGTAMGGALGILFMVPYPFPPGEYTSVATPLAVALLVIALLIPRTGTTRNHPLWPLVFVLGFLSVLWVASQGQGGKKTGLILLTLLSLTGLLVGQRLTKEDIRALARALWYVCLVELAVNVGELMGAFDPIWGIAQGDLLGSRPNPLLLDAVDRAQGTAGHPTLLALLYVITAFFSMAAMKERGKLRTYGQLALLACGLVASGTRATLLIMVAVGLAMLILEGGVKGRTRLLAYVALLVAVTPFVAGSLVQYFAEISNSTIDSGSYTHRISGFDATSRLVNSRPAVEALFGSGYDVNDLFIRGLLQQDGFHVIDNQYVTVLAISGMAGLAFYVLLILGALKSGRGLPRAIVLLMAINGLAVDVAYAMMPSALLCFLGLGMAANVRKESTAKSEMREVEPRAGVWASVA